MIAEWLGTEDAIAIADDASVSEARLRARRVAAEQGLGLVQAERLVLIASELARNQLRHAWRGQIAVRAIARGEQRGVEIVAVDEGPGISDPELGLRGVPRGAGSLGVGLAAARENADEIDFDVRIQEGTVVRARVFENEVPRRREVGVFGRPYRLERQSGDHACFFRSEDRLLIGVCDGLGHGAPAREASGMAMRTFAAHRTASPQAILEECHGALGPTRGVVMSVVSLPEGAGSCLDLASVGNITIELVRPRGARRFAASSFVLGSPRRGWRPHVEAAPFQPDETLIVFTDGISSRSSISEDLELLREHPIVIAQRLVQRFGRDDDVLVLVAR